MLLYILRRRGSNVTIHTGEESGGNVTIHTLEGGSNVTTLGRVVSVISVYILGRRMAVKLFVNVIPSNDKNEKTYIWPR